MKEFEAVKCPVCDTVGKWESVDKFRHKAQKMCICTACGFVTYPEKILNVPKMLEYYELDYRNAPTANNLHSGERKLHLHAAFLDDLLKEWKAKGVKDPDIFEVGAAFGLFLHWLKQRIPGAKVAGTELTKTYVRNAWHLYKIALGKDFDDKAHDLIVSYKVLEHMANPDVELKRYAEAIKNGGKLYVSVPIWFDKLNNFGMGGFSLEYYYHTNHINVWTRQNFEHLLAKAGLKIVKADHYLYDSTYLCEAGTPAQTTIDNPETVKAKMQKIFEAANHFELGQFEQAIERWPFFPDAWAAYYETARGKLNKLGYDQIRKEVLDKALAACQRAPETLNFAGDVSMRYKQWKTALELFNESNGKKPNDPGVLIAVSHCFRQMADEAKDKKEAQHLWGEAMNLCLFVTSLGEQSKADALTWAMSDAARLETPAEAT